MLKNLAISLINSDEGLLDAALLKKAHDSEVVEHELEDILELEKAARIYGDKSDFLIAKLGENEVAGYTVGRKIEHNNTYHSSGVYVVPKYRSKGIGTELKRAQIELAKEYGCSEISASTEKDNLACIKVLEKLGFKITIYEEGGCFASLNLKPEKK